MHGNGGGMATYSVRHTPSFRKIGLFALSPDKPQCLPYGENTAHRDVAALRAASKGMSTRDAKRHHRDKFERAHRS